MINRLKSLLILFLFALTFDAPANSLESYNTSGFPQTLREAGECFFGNHDAVVESLEDNVSINHYRIKRINLNLVPPNMRSSKTDVENIKSANMLVNTNIGLKSLVSRLKGKCSSFPSWD